MILAVPIIVLCVLFDSLLFIKFRTISFHPSPLGPIYTLLYQGQQLNSLSPKLIYTLLKLVSWPQGENWCCLSDREILFNTLQRTVDLLMSSCNTCYFAPVFLHTSGMAACYSMLAKQTTT